MEAKKFNLKEILSKADEARERIKSLPKWQQEAIKIVSYSAASKEARKVLYG